MNTKTLKKKLNLRTKRKKKVRSKIFGTALLPRVTIFKSNKYITAQAIDDTKGVTLTAIDGKKLGLTANKESAAKIGTEFAKNLKSVGIEKIVFDRNGYLYHGVVAAFADGLRANGIKL